jgi:recombination protein RecA
MDIRRIGALKDGEKVVGNRTRVKVVKNKLSPPFREVEFDIMYGEGISREGDVLDLATDNNILEKSGAWFAWQGERIGQGRENAKQFLREHPEVMASIEKKVLEHFGIVRRDAAAATSGGSTAAAATASAAPGKGSTAATGSSTPARTESAAAQLAPSGAVQGSQAGHGAHGAGNGAEEKRKRSEARTHS